MSQISRERSFGKLIKCLTICFIVMAMYISRALQKMVLRGVSQLVYFSKYLSPNRKERFEHRSGNGIEISGGERSASLHMLWLVGDGK